MFFSVSSHVTTCHVIDIWIKLGKLSLELEINAVLFKNIYALVLVY